MPTRLRVSNLSWVARSPAMWQKKVVAMSLLASSVIGDWEIILVLAVVLILYGAKNLPDLAKGLEQLRLEQTGKRGGENSSDLFLAGLTIILGAISLILIVYEFSK